MDDSNENVLTGSASQSLLIKPDISTPLIDSKRIDLQTLINKFHNQLGDKNWLKYQSIFSSFILGKLSRNEFENEITKIINSNLLINFHNQFILSNLANSVRINPSPNSHISGFGFNNNNLFNMNNSNKKKKNLNNYKFNNQYEVLKTNIMSLPVKERRRIKNIKRDSGKSNLLSANSSLYITNPQNNKSSSQPREVITGNAVTWSQDIMTGFQTLLASESYELPDKDTLNYRMTGIMREHGLFGSLDENSINVMSMAIESHLKTIIEETIDLVRYRKSKYDEN
ncbi:Hfi1p ASCRUDRAFT_35372, partial [Ascoidea rubescens DSM 1968]